MACAVITAIVIKHAEYGERQTLQGRNESQKLRDQTNKTVLRKVSRSALFGIKQRRDQWRSRSGAQGLTDPGNTLIPFFVVGNNYFVIHQDKATFFVIMLDQKEQQIQDPARSQKICGLAAKRADFNTDEIIQEKRYQNTTGSGHKSKQRWHTTRTHFVSKKIIILYQLSCTRQIMILLVHTCREAQGQRFNFLLQDQMCRLLRLRYLCKMYFMLSNVHQNLHLPQISFWLSNLNTLYSTRWQEAGCLPFFKDGHNYCLFQY